ncbi:MAG: transposase [Verrucomicrobiota bacterium]
MWTFQSYPDQLPVRIIQFKVQVKGFRTSKITLMTTLLDPELYPTQKIIDLFRKRWEIETGFRYLKTTMKMEVLRCLSPEMIQKEILMHFIAYNLIRKLMLHAALDS